jgi:hypothetical protein
MALCDPFIPEQEHANVKIAQPKPKKPVNRALPKWLSR